MTVRGTKHVYFVLCATGTKMKIKSKKGHQKIWYTKQTTKGKGKVIPVLKYSSMHS